MANYKGGHAGLLEENLPWVKIKPGRTIRGLRAQREMPSAIAWHLLLGLLQSRRIQLVLAFTGEQNYNASEVMQSSDGKLINRTHRGLRVSPYTFHTGVMRLTVWWHQGAYLLSSGSAGPCANPCRRQQIGNWWHKRQPEKANWPSLLVPCDFSRDGEVSATNVYAY